MTAEVLSSALRRIDHVEALTLADTIPTRQLFTIGLPQHTEGTSMVALIISSCCGGIGSQVALLHDLTPALVGELQAELTVVSVVIATL